MFDGVPLSYLDSLSSVALVILFGIAVGRGWIVTAREHANTIHDRDEWRSESRLKDSQIAEKDRQLAALAEVGRTIEHVMGALQDQDRGNP